jgi:hypothetical protein
LSLRLDASEAYRLAHAYRDEVLAEADLLPQADVVAWLVKKAREGFPGADVLASKVERGAIRPDNLRTLPPDFFEPGHTYEWGPYTFLVEAVAANPETGVRTAIGWWRTGEGLPWLVHEYSDVHWSTVWTDVTGGAS